MVKENLKNYKKHLNKLVTLANSFGVTVEFKPELDDGIYIPSKRKIRIDDDMTQTETIATLLHEIGHLLDDVANVDVNVTSMSKAYKAVYYGRPTKLQKVVVVNCEIRAWLIGSALAKNLKINLGSWYDVHMASALNSYLDVKCR